MNCKSTPFIQIEREYKITSRELKRALKIEGDINSILFYQGRSQNDIEKGVSIDCDIWEIKTVEKKKKGD